MEPLDPKAELMRLAATWVGAALATALNPPVTSDEEARRKRAEDRAQDALSAAITLALAAERRLGMTEAAKMCDKMSEQYNGHGDCADVIRALIDGKAGGT